MTVVHTKGRYFKFDSKETLTRFTDLYCDLFTPYSDSYIQSDWRKRMNNDVEYNNMKKGYITNPFYDDELLIRVNLSKENLDKILEGKCFTKCKLEPQRRSYGREVYILKGQE